MKELEEIKKKLNALAVCQNCYIKVSDVKNVIAFIEGLIYEKETKSESERA